MRHRRKNRINKNLTEGNKELSEEWLKGSNIKKKRERKQNGDEVL
jgi:hypothetical protein